MARPRDAQTPPPDLTMRIDGDRIVGRLFGWSLGAMLLLGVLDYVFEFRRLVPDKSIRRIFNCAREGSVPTWFSVTLLGLTALTLFVVFFLSRRRGAKWTTRAAWLLLACFFLFMAIDDAAEIHERLGGWLGSKFREDTSGQPGWLRAIMESEAYSWQIFLGPVFAAMGLFMLVFLWRHFGRHGLKRWLFLGLACYVVAVRLDGLERIEGYFEQVADGWGWTRWEVSHTSKVTEELLEMLGTLCFWIGSMRYFLAEADGLWFTLGRPAAD